MDVSPALNQGMIAVSTFLAAFSVGGAVTYPSLLMQQLTADDPSVPLDVHTRSWIGSIYGLAGIPVILMPVVTHKVGRKFGFIIACLYILVGWVLTYTASTTTQILISETFHGLGVNSVLPVGFLSMSEMLAPNNRFITMQAFGIAQGLGMSTTGILGRFFHFKTISIIMFIPIAIAVAITSMWPESPPWLACKGKFEECKQAFVKLRGADKISTKELNELITAQREIFALGRSRTSFNSFWTQITSKDFYMPAFHTFVLMNMMYWSGCDVVLIYFLEMASKTTSNENATFYAAIVIYVIIVVGLIITDVLVAKFENKKVLLTSTFFMMVFLICACIVTGLQSLKVISNDSLLCVICLLLCICSSSLGLASIVFILPAELMPVRHRSLGGAFYVILNCILYASSQKISPYMFMYIDLWGTFLLYAANAIVCGVYVWKFVPETRGKSLQEIEDYYTYGKFIVREIDPITSSVEKTLIENCDQELLSIDYGK